MNYQELINKAKATGFEAIEVTERTFKEMNIAIFNGAVDKNEMSDITRLSIRAIYDGKMAYYNTENQDSDIDKVLGVLKKNASLLTTTDKFEIFAGSKEYPVIEKVTHDFDNYTMLDNINMLKKLEADVKAGDKRIKYVSHCTYSQEENTMKIYNSKGLQLQKSNAYCAVAIQAVASENKDTCSGFSISAKLKRAEIDPQTICDEVIKKTVSMLNAKPIASGTYPVIIDNEQMSSLLSAFLSAFSGDAAVKGITPFVGKENSKIMSDKITICDNPLLTGPDILESEPFDDEGVACYQKKVVDKGVFKTMLYDLKSAKYFNTTSTGNGFKRGMRITPTGHNLYIEAGNTSQEEMIKSINKGLLITALDGLHAGVDPISGNFSLKASGYYILDGKIDKAVTLIVIAGNFYKLMNEEVETVGSDLKMRYSSIGAPSIKFSSIAVSGE